MEIKKAINLLVSNGYIVHNPNGYLNNELGVIAIDSSTGQKIYEDKVHNLGEGKYMYYIQTECLPSGYYVIPEKEGIPRESWGKVASNRWIQWYNKEEFLYSTHKETLGTQKETK
jgi:hypothetical protein